MLGLFRRRTHERAGFALYSEAVRAARDPYFYTALGVPDTLDGRFDLVGLHVFLLIDRLRNADAPGPKMAQAVFDAMFADMDFNLREMGVGDMSVARRNKEMWEALHGRSKAYEEALAGGAESMADVLRRNVWRGHPPEGAESVLSGIVDRARAALAARPLDAFSTGTAGFPATQPVPA